MTRRKTPLVTLAPLPSPDQWLLETGKVLSLGDLVKITGIRGRYTIKRFSTEPISGPAVTVFGGISGDMPCWRTFTINRVTRVRK